LAGNLTPVGSVANLIVAERARRRYPHFPVDLLPRWNSDRGHHPGARRLVSEL